MRLPRCRFCSEPLQHTFVDLGMSPLCESFVAAEHAHVMEPFYPLHVWVCESCFLVQLEEFVSPQQIFSEYAYFSSYSSTWLAHAADYVDAVVERFRLDARSMVVELASNDGYLLRNVVARGIPALGVEPAANVARAAEAQGVHTVVEFFGTATARMLVGQGKAADLVVANNVVAHVPDLNDFVEGIRLLLKPAGVVTIEVPHLLRLMSSNQYDTIYHEHFSYFSLATLERVLAAHGLRVFDVEELKTHGGSLRVFAGRDEHPHEVTARVGVVREHELAAGLRTLPAYASFGEAVKASKRDLLAFLVDAKRAGKRIVGYGAPGKGNTLLNYCGIRTDFLDFTVDRNPYKHGKLLPGTRIPVRPPEDLDRARPDYVLLLPWNLEAEIVAQLTHIREWGARFIVAIPTVRVVG